MSNQTVDHVEIMLTAPSVVVKRVVCDQHSN